MLLMLDTLTLPSLHVLTLWSGAAASALVSATWQGIILATCIALCLRLSPSSGAAGRSLLWMAGYLVVVLLHFSSLIAYHAGHVGSSHTLTLRFSPIWALAIAALWAPLSLYRAVRLGLSAWSLRGIARRATAIPCDQACTALLKSGRRPVKLCLSHDIDRPSVIGFRSPRILLPAALLAELSASELEQVILHEMEHLRRADDWTNLLQKLVLVVFPLNPVLLWIEHRLCAERELACDDGVLRQTRARKAYASCLTHLAEYPLVRHTATLALGAWDRRSELSLRVYRILRQTEPTSTTHHTRWVTALSALALLAGAGELARSPQLIRFAPQPTLAQAAPASLPRLDFLPASAHLLPAKAVMPTESVIIAPTHRRARPAVLSSSIHPSLPSLRVVSNRSVAHSPTQWVVLASFIQPYGRGSLAVQPDILPAYAAVPVEDGWLIIQL